MRVLLGVCLGVLLSVNAHAQTPLTWKEIEDANKEFAGIKFGVGFGVTLDTGSRDRVDQASVDANGIVRVDKKTNNNVRLFLETHILPWCGSTGTAETRTFGCGPFLALQPGTDQVIQSIGLGFMWGWRRPESPKQSFNLGIGAILDQNVKVLGDEFKENEPAPVDPATGRPLPIRYQTTDQGGVLLFASFTW